MKDPAYLDDVTVELVDIMGTDRDIMQAARVSVVGANLAEDGSDTAAERLINYLLTNKHGSPFEHTALKFYVKAPIFVFREFHRHRIGFSYNEISGRYAELPGEFYLPKPTRPMFNSGTSARPEFEITDESAQKDAHDIVQFYSMRAYKDAWSAYQNMLKAGVANEVARIVLPVGIFSQMYVTCNARSIMNFLSLRTHDVTATHVSRPQHEIELVARKMEAIFAEHFPLTYKSFSKNGRVAP